MQNSTHQTSSLFHCFFKSERRELIRVQTPDSQFTGTKHMAMDQEVQEQQQIQPVAHCQSPVLHNSNSPAANQQSYCWGIVKEQEEVKSAFLEVEVNFVEIDPSYGGITRRRQLEQRLCSYRLAFKRDKFFTFLLNSLPKVRRWNIEELIFNHQDSTQNPFYQSLTIRIISPIKFPHLKILTIKNSNIQSIEVLSHLQAPELLQINLNSNRITCTFSLRKVRLPKIRKIQLWGNKIQPDPYISEVHMPCLSQRGMKSWIYKTTRQILKAQLAVSQEFRTGQIPQHTFNLTRNYKSR